MSFDLKTAISSIAPTIATMLGGPLAGGAVASLMGAFGLTSAGSQQKDISQITQVIQSGSMTPEIIAAVRAADQKHEEVLKQQNIDLVKINQAHEDAQFATQTADTQDARKTFGQSNNALGYVILITFACLMTAELWGCYMLLTGGITLKDVAIVAAIANVVGSITGYVASNAQQVVNYKFGSSAGSQGKDDAIALHMTKLIDASGTPK